MEQVSIKKNYIYNMLLTVANLLFPVITYTYASRILMPEGIGKTTFAASVVSYFSMFAHLGIPTYGIRACAQKKDDKKELSKTVKELLSINILMAVISISALAIITVLSGRLFEIKGLILIYAIGLVASVFELSWLFSALEKYEYITKRSLILKALSVALIFLLINDSSDIPIYAGIAVGTAVMTSLVNFIYSRKFVDLKIKAECNLKQHIKPIVIFFLMSAATTIYLNLDTVMLGFMTSDAEVGIYSAATKIKGVLTGVVTALGAVMLPRMSMLIAQNNRKSFLEYATKAMNYVWVISVPIVIYFSIYAGDCISLLSGELFRAATPAMKVIMPTVLLIGITNILGIQMLVPLGKEKVVLYSEIAGAITDIVLNYIFIPIYGAVGAALGTLAAEAVVLIFQVSYMKKEIKNIFTKVSYIKIIIGNIGAILTILFFNNFLTANSPLIVLVKSSIIYFGIYFLILLLLKEQLVLECLSLLKSRLRH